MAPRPTDEPPAPSPAVVEPVEATALEPPGAPGPVRRSRRWHRRLLVGLNIVVALCLVATASGYVYLRVEFGRIKRQVFPNGTLTVSAGKAMNVLLVGSDARAALDPSEAQFGSGTQVGGQRSDVIMILHADPSEQKAAILSLPRDLFVPIAGTKRSDRINSAFDGGPAALVQ